MTSLYPSPTGFGTELRLLRAAVLSCPVIFSSMGRLVLIGRSGLMPTHLSPRSPNSVG
ncbi:uncharacterized protein BO80DRAFT_70657 [Aspergillus ibericus CBS 121593]|uniref:Uncharacterized protein n=1 Tax=Aspergillus ibericus CBS 121593 TaxID=1448316 RepID=A0A395GZZ5_9EURO|nr:hypothetical protein BO80DRAFT_70657 [Aspergillus ibericus CBS 121593]RAL01136.1 hypothetical protein BO80DRAFT_70657 [Aspergillus ibericus CBS 121593]